MAARFNPPPNWPIPPGWQPRPGWQPDPAWGPVPAGWVLWADVATDAGSASPAGPWGNWFARHRILVGAVAGVLVLIMIISRLGGEDPGSTNLVAGEGSSPERTTSASNNTSTHSVVRPKVATSTTAAVVVQTKQVSETEVIAFAAVTRDDPTMAAGATVVAVAGVNGVRTLSYDVVYTDGVETARTLVIDVVTTPAVDQVTLIGTYVAPPPPQPPPPPPPPPPADACDPNYSGACVPVDSDVDCAGGSGNGPSYVRGPVTVIGSDIYDLDSDGDGVGCES